MAERRNDKGRRRREERGGDRRSNGPRDPRALKRTPARSVRPVRKNSAAPEKDDPATGPVRLNRYLSQSGVCSRREADDLIQAGVVQVNGKVVTELGTKVGPGDVVVYGGQRLSMERKRYVLLNKPKDFITTTDDPRDRRTVMNLVGHACPERIYPVGRLDRNTTGVLLLTNDGDLAKRLTHPRHGVEKLYHVFLNRSVTQADVHRLVEGVALDDGPANADEASYVGADKKQVGVRLHSGRNRVVRRMFEALGYEVMKLDRVVFAGLTKKDLPRGKWRHLTEKEINLLRRVR
ncbi:MAG: rRNA pseudouridine synthase [Flavobacteriales bacterium]|nr:rRNA pseudouridine synthase [Flavobacteriales bacterium]MCB9167837.1 rRNA pseudouridine synthase [Flavobacteriales bacterium]